MHKGRYAPRFLEQYWSVGCTPPFFAPLACFGNFYLYLDGVYTPGSWASYDSRSPAFGQFEWDTTVFIDGIPDHDGYLSQVANRGACNVYFYIWLNIRGVILTAKADFKDKNPWQWPFFLLQDDIEHLSTTPGHDVQWISFDADAVPYY